MTRGDYYVLTVDVDGDVYYIDAYGDIHPSFEDVEAYSTSAKAHNARRVLRREHARDDIAIASVDI